MSTADEYRQNTLAIAEALAGLWDAVRERHRDVPASTAVLGHGRGAPAWGHRVYPFAAGTDTVLELHIEPMDLPDTSPLTILETMLHDAAHGLAAHRSIKDTSNKGRYHSKKFAALAAEVGLTVPDTAERVYGYWPRGLAEGTAEAYAEPLMELADVRTLPWKWPLETPEVRSTNRTNWIPAACACTPPHRIRCAETLLETAAPVCPTCTRPYTATSTKETS
jgi:hypothetical protein